MFTQPVLEMISARPGVAKAFAQRTRRAGERLLSSRGNRIILPLAQPPLRSDSSNFAKLTQSSAPHRVSKRSQRRPSFFNVRYSAARPMIALFFFESETAELMCNYLTFLTLAPGLYGGDVR